MKKIILIPFLFVSFFAFGQATVIDTWIDHPIKKGFEIRVIQVVTQSDSTIVKTFYPEPQTLGFTKRKAKEFADEYVESPPFQFIERRQ